MIENPDLSRIKAGHDSDKSIIAKKYRMAVPTLPAFGKALRVIGITGTDIFGNAVGPRNELLAIADDGPKIAHVRTQRGLESLITKKLGMNKRERTKRKIKVDITAS